jgi:hypothetical protein
MLLKFKYPRVDLFRIPRLLDNESLSYWFYCDLEDWLHGKVSQFVTNIDYNHNYANHVLLYFVDWGSPEVIEICHNTDLLYFPKDKKMTYIHTPHNFLINYNLLVGYKPSDFENEDYKTHILF